MTALTRRIIAAALVAACVGCGQGEPTKPGTPTPDGKGGPGPTGPTSDQPVTPTPNAPGTPAPMPLGPQEPASKAVEAFVADLRKASDAGGPLPADLLARVSPAFLKVIGKPLLTPDDQNRGYSDDTAQAWLRRAGQALTGIGLPTGFGSPTSAVFVGSFGNGTGRLLIRTVQADGGWKIDWFGLGTAKAGDAKPASADGPYQDFAVLAFLDALTGNASSKDDRTALLGAAVAPKLRQAWASPFEQDKAQGRDFNPGLLGQMAEKVGGGTTAFTRSTVGIAGEYQVELVKGKETKAYTLKLVKGAGPGEWLVDEFNP